MVLRLEPPCLEVKNRDRRRRFQREEARGGRDIRLLKGFALRGLDRRFPILPSARYGLPVILVSPFEYRVLEDSVTLLAKGEAEDLKRRSCHLLGCLRGQEGLAKAGRLDELGDDHRLIDRVHIVDGHTNYRCADAVETVDIAVGAAP